MNRPYIMCHMLTSIDGKTTGSFLDDNRCKEAIDKYYQMHASHKFASFACGRVTMEEGFTYHLDNQDYLTTKEYIIDIVRILNELGYECEVNFYNDYKEALELVNEHGSNIYEDNLVKTFKEDISL